MNATDYTLIIECLTGVAIAAILGIVIIIISGREQRKAKLWVGPIWPNLGVKGSGLSRTYTSDSRITRINSRITACVPANAATMIAAAYAKNARAKWAIRTGR